MHRKQRPASGPPLAPRSPRHICCPLLPPPRAPWLCPHDCGWLFTPGCGDEPPEQQEGQRLGAPAEGTRAGREARPCCGAGWGRGVRRAPGKGQPLCDCGPFCPQGRPVCGCSRGPQTLQSPHFPARPRGHRDFSAPLCSGGISLLEVYFLQPLPLPPASPKLVFKMLLNTDPLPVSLRRKQVWEACHRWLNLPGSGDRAALGAPPLLLP